MISKTDCLSLEYRPSVVQDKTKEGCHFIGTCKEFPELLCECEGHSRTMSETRYEISNAVKDFKKEGKRLPIPKEWSNLINKAEVLLQDRDQNQHDYIFLTLDLPNPLHIDVKRQPDLYIKIETLRDEGIDYVRNNFYMEPEIINVRKENV